LPIAVGKRINVRMASRSGPVELIECVAVALDNDLIWCRCLRALPVDRRPVAGVSVSLTLQDGDTGITGKSEIRAVRLTRRGLWLGVTKPGEWLTKTERTSVRVPTDITAHVLRQSDMSRSGPGPMPATICDLSVKGARLRGRLVLHKGERLLITFRLDGSDEEHAVVAEVIRTIRTSGSGSTGYEAGVAFVKTLKRTQAALERYVEANAQRLSTPDDDSNLDLEQELADLRLGNEPDPSLGQQKVAGLEWVDDELLDCFRDVA